MVYSIKRKELYAYICRKYPRTCPSTITESTEFFLFTVVFLQPFALSLSFFLQSFFFFFVPYLFFFLCITYYNFLHNFLRPRVGQVLGVPFLFFPYLFLNLPFLAVRLLVHYSGITSTLMRQES